MTFIQAEVVELKENHINLTVNNQSKTFTFSPLTSNCSFSHYLTVQTDLDSSK